MEAKTNLTTINAMNITNRKKSVSFPKAWAKCLADYPNGKGIYTADLGGDVVYDGTPVYLSSGICKVQKTAMVYENAGSSATTYKIYKGSHLKVGDTVTNGSTSYAITAMGKSNALYDTISVGTTLGAATKDTTILVVGSNTVVGLVTGHHEVLESGKNLEAGVGVIGTVKEGNLKQPLTSTMKSALKGIVFI